MALFPSKNSLRGNVLFIVLLGVVLFGALSYAVVNSNSDSGDTGSAEQARIYAGEIVRYAQSMRAAVDRMRMNGVSENDIRFAHPDLDAAYGTLGTTPKNEVFHPDGGGMSYLKPKEEWLDSTHSGDLSYRYGNFFFSSQNHIPGLGETNSATCSDATCSELIMLLMYIKKDICIAINETLGVASNNAEPDIDAGVFNIGNRFSGTFPSSAAPIQGSNSDLYTLESYCIAAGSSPPAGSYHFYQVLIVR